MTKEEKLATIMAQLEDTANLRILIKAMVAQALSNADETIVDQVYYLLNPEP